MRRGQCHLDSLCEFMALGPPHSGPGAFSHPHEQHEQEHTCPHAPQAAPRAQPFSRPSPSPRSSRPDTPHPPGRQRRTVPGGERVSITSRPVAPEKGALATAEVTAKSLDYPSALWVPANSGNFATGCSATIDKVVIHVAHIIGHSEAPGNDHTDPGPYWNWTYYMQLVTGTGTGSGGSGAAGSLDFSSYAPQQTGSTGPQVKAVQQLLNDQGYEAGAVDGVFGAATKSAVQAFQTARALAADGAVGPRTWTALLSAGTTPTLTKGSTGEPVKRLQRALTAALGSTAGPGIGIDGVFGTATDTAVRDYQRTRNLAADGIVGTGTWAALQTGR